MHTYQETETIKSDDDARARVIHFRLDREKENKETKARYVLAV